MQPKVVFLENLIAQKVFNHFLRFSPTSFSCGITLTFVDRLLSFISILQGANVRAGVGEGGAYFLQMPHS